MHPGFYRWWKERSGGFGPDDRGGEAREHGHCGPRGHHHEHHEHAAAGEGEGPFSGFGGGGQFGVRRPLRFMAQKLGLREEQITELAVLLDELKTERAQAEVDYRRTLGAFADALTGAGGIFDAAKATEAGKARVASADKIRTAVHKTLEKTHAILDEEQRKKLAYLLRTGVLTI